MGLEKILNNTSILKLLTVKIDGQEIVNDDIVTVEIKQDFFEFGITGSLKLKDSFDLMNSGLITLGSKNNLTISMMDFLEDKVIRTFRIVDVKTTPADDRFKIIDITFIDEISFILRNTYISKSFTDTPVNALKQYLTHVGIDEIITTDKMSYDITDTSTSRSFVVPQNVSALEFFTKILKEENIRLWQDRTKICISEVAPSKLVLQKMPNDETSTVLFTNDTLNNTHVFKVHDYSETKNPSFYTNEMRPIETIYRYNGTKEILDTTLNLNDVKIDLVLATTDVSELQQTVGSKYSTQEVTTTLNQNYDLFNTYMLNNQMYVVVPGSLNYTKIGTIVDIKLKGNPVYSKGALEADITSSGKYFVSAVNDRILGNKIITRMSLNRVDAQALGK